MAAKQTKPQAPAKPAAPVTADVLKAANKPAPANGAVTEEMVLAYLEMQEKGSEILKKARNTIWRKIAQKEPNAELLAVLREAVKMHGFEQVKLCYLAVRKEQPMKAKAEKAEAES